MTPYAQRVMAADDDPAPSGRYIHFKTQADHQAWMAENANDA